MKSSYIRECVQELFYGVILFVEVNRNYLSWQSDLQRTYKKVKDLTPVEYIQQVRVDIKMEVFDHEKQHLFNHILDTFIT